ncbi:FHA domain-containing protein [Spirosoma sp. KCTC 42546]|uniref:FHA domain-containing protein n=1 Tax=Spirosoma sp. KCTC 42546 TaxID=2520506 RepID=UPI0011584906|nr:FHA domain-containing protein [Spirosoma sp. KCTC 42546]QDK78879.1 FHA domain-containing protein [Spirosoma sp. KCTC 42546]
MSGFKTTLINCRQCGRRILVRAADAERGSIMCSHVGCGAINELQKLVHYDESIVQGLPEFGQLTYLGNAESSYSLQFGRNVIGTSETCTVRVTRFVHEGRCFISRRHCTLTITFDKWTGQLRYQLQDGAIDDTTHTHHYSLNGTLLNGIPLQKNELIDVDNGGIITLGGVDRFRLTHFPIPPAMLDTYKIELGFNPDRTQ